MKKLLPKLNSVADKYNLDITISLDYVPEEYDYNLILVDRHSRLLGIGKTDAKGGKSITIPNWCFKEEDYTLKVQTLEGNEVVSEESYNLSFRENTLQMQYLTLQGGMKFDCVVRRKLWQRGKQQNREIPVAQRERYEEEYRKQMDAIYCDGQEFLA